MILNAEQRAAIFDMKDDGYLRITKQALESLRETFADLQRQLAERDAEVEKRAYDKAKLFWKGFYETDVQQRVDEAQRIDGPILAKILFELNNQIGDAPWPIDWDRQPYCQWAIRDSIKILERLAAARSRTEGKPMACGHPKACWQKRDAGLVGESRVEWVSVEGVHPEYFCTACEDKRLAVATALREAVLAEHDWCYQMSGKMSPEAHASWHAHRHFITVHRSRTEGKPEGK